VRTLFDAALDDVWPSLQPGTRPPCRSGVPAPSMLSTFSTVCSDDLPLHSVLVATAAAEATTQVNTDTTGTQIQSTSQVDGVQLLDGVISIGSIRTQAVAQGDGSPGGTRSSLVDEVRSVCVGSDCTSYTLTAGGICVQAQTACSNNPVNKALRSQGFNVCLLGQAQSKAGTSTAATASGVLVEFHAKSVPAPPNPGPGVPGTGSTFIPDPDYYSSFGDAPCEAAAPAPHVGWSGISMYVILGESSVQLHTDVFPSSTIPITADTTPPAFDAGGGGSSTTTVTTIVNNPNGGGVYPGKAQSAPAKAPSLALVFGKVNDRRPLMLAVFGLLELILLSNLTAMARARRRRT
jgi:hypothetical protein